jgi:hypothetical protein
VITLSFASCCLQAGNFEVCTVINSSVYDIRGRKLPSYAEGNIPYAYIFLCIFFRTQYCFMKIPSVYLKMFILVSYFIFIKLVS